MMLDFYIEEAGLVNLTVMRDVPFNITLRPVDKKFGCKIRCATDGNTGKRSLFLFPIAPPCSKYIIDTHQVIQINGTIYYFFLSS